MNSKYRRLALALAVLGGACFAGAETAEAQQKQSQIQAQIEHGRYLVHEVARCVQCHSPRTDDGTLIESRLLQGAPIPLKSPYPNQVWAYRSPQIAGLPGWTNQEIMTLLMTGARPNGRYPRLPMQRFHMTQKDAAAVVAYLRSLTD
jgi:mono/diheme cytochrome c family protein